MVIVVSCKIHSPNLTSRRLIHVLWRVQAFIFKFSEQGIFISDVPSVLSYVGLCCSHHGLLFCYLYRVCCSIGELHLSCQISGGFGHRISFKIAICKTYLRTQKLTDISTSLRSWSRSLWILTADSTRAYLIGDVRIHTQFRKLFEQFLFFSSLELKLLGLVFVVANKDIFDIPHEMISVGSRWLRCLISSLAHLIKILAWRHIWLMECTSCWCHSPILKAAVSCCPYISLSALLKIWLHQRVTHVQCGSTLHTHVIYHRHYVLGLSHSNVASLGISTLNLHWWRFLFLELLPLRRDNLTLNQLEMRHHLDWRLYRAFTSWKSSISRLALGYIKLFWIILKQTFEI